MFCRSCIPVVGKGIRGLGVHGVSSNLLLFSGIPIFENDSMSLTVLKFRFYFHFVLVGTTVVFIVQDSCSHSLDIRHVWSCICNGMINDRTAMRAIKGHIQFVSGLTVCNHTRNDERHLILIVALNGIALGDNSTSVHIGRECTILVGIFNDGGQSSRCDIAIRFRSPCEALDIDHRHRFCIIGIGCRSISANQRIFKINRQCRVCVIHRPCR